MAGTGSSMVYSHLLFDVQEVYRGKLASSERFTILGGFTSSLLFLVLLIVSSEKSRANSIIFLVDDAVNHL